MCIHVNICHHVQSVGLSDLMEFFFLLDKFDQNKLIWSSLLIFFRQYQLFPFLSYCTWMWIRCIYICLALFNVKITELFQVTLTLLGADGNSEPHHLADPKKRLFESGAVDMFLLTTPFSLGDLQSLRLWHNNTGSHPAWYANSEMFTLNFVK